MPREEIVQRYLEGQMSRRVFLRRLIATGVSVVAAVSYTDLLQGLPAGAAVPDLYLFVQDFQFLPKAPVVTMGGDVDWAFSTANAYWHSATETSGLGWFDTGPVHPGGVAENAGHFPAAGTFPYRCPEGTHVLMTGKIKVPMTSTPTSGPLGTTFSITWSTESLTGLVFDIQRQTPGSTTWTGWKTGVTTLLGNMKPGVKGTFKLRARVRNPVSGSHSAWSPPLSVSVT